MTFSALFRRGRRQAPRGELLVRNRYVLLADVALCAASLFLAFALRFDLRFLAFRHEFFPLLIVALTIKTPLFFAFGLYRRFWRYASLNDMLVVGLAVSTASVVLGVVAGVGRSFALIGDVSRAVLLIDWLLTLVTIGAVRAAVRILGESAGRARAVGSPRVNGESSHKKRVLVVGAGEAGAMVVREMQRNPQLEMTVVGFLDDDYRKQGHRIYGTLVMGPTSEVERVVKVGRIEEVIIAMPRASGTAVRAVAERCRALGIPCRTIPGVFELLDGQVDVSRLRKIEISDLLRRAPIEGEVDTSSYVTGQTVLVTGAGGSIGSELCRQVAASRPSRLILLGHGENSLFDAQLSLRQVFPSLALDVAVADVRDRERLMKLFQRFRPRVVLHAAAHKHVPLMEDNPEEAISNNILGTRNIVDASLAVSVARLVMISTDKAVAPSSLMGASKRVAESIVRTAARQHAAAFLVVRFGNVLGSRGSVVPFFKQQIEQGGPVTVTHPEMRRFFMTIPEAVHLVLQAGGLGRGAELFVLDMGAPVRIVDLAQDLITLSGFRTEEIPIVFTGIRPGEKLEEALWEQGAVVEATECPSVLRVTEGELCEDREIGAMIESVEHAASTGNRLHVEAELARWIPTYVPASAVRQSALTV
jgi:FlaA1/EpsC-like NDP-sugar epimerase